MLNVSLPLSTLAKVFLLSTVLSLGIKYGAPLLSIPPQDWIATIAILTPTVIMAIILSIQSQKAE
ncbi:MAG: hypothetical protein VKJ24_00695 [Synechococcales bacterium]|nr:hypothetical protein [Synechococcales bacterium]